MLSFHAAPFQQFFRFFHGFAKGKKASPRGSRAARRTDEGSFAAVARLWDCCGQFSLIRPCDLLPKGEVLVGHASSFFLCLDDLQAAELFAFAFAQDLVDGLDGLLHLGYLHVAQGVGALLVFWMASARRITLVSTSANSTVRVLTSLNLR